MLTGLPIPKTICKAKDPTTCRYHGAYNDLREAYIELTDVIKIGGSIGPFLEQYYQMRQAVETLEKNGWTEEQLNTPTEAVLGKILSLKKSQIALDTLFDHAKKKDNHPVEVSKGKKSYKLIPTSFWETDTSTLVELLFKIEDTEFQVIGWRSIGVDNENYYEWEGNAVSKV